MTSSPAALRRPGPLLAPRRCFGIALGASCLLLSVEAQQPSSAAPPDAEAKRVDRLIEQARDPMAPARTSAIQELGQIRSSESLRVLSELSLQDPDLSVQDESLLSLGAHGEMAIPSLLAVVRQRPTPRAKVSAARAFGLIATRRAEDELLLLADPKEPLEVRVAATRALGSVAGSRSQERLLAFARESQAELQIAALESMGRRANREVVPAVDEMARGDDAAVAARACWALGELRDDRAVPTLIATLSRPAPPVRREAALALGRIGDARALAPLAALARSTQEPVSVRLGAVKAMGMLREAAQAAPALAELLRDQQPPVRAVAVHALVLQGSGSAEQLAPLLADADPRVREAAVQAMGLFPQRFAARLAALTADTEQALPLRIMALTALAELPVSQVADAPILDPLRTLLSRDRPLDLQVGAVRFLSRVETNAARSALDRFASEAALDPAVVAALRDRQQR